MGRSSARGNKLLKRLVGAGAFFLLPGASDGHRAPPLNHVYVVLDRATFDAIRDNAPLTAILGPGDTGLPAYAQVERGADRFFLRGQQTYLELFAPENRFDEPLGKVGIGVGTDTAAAFGRIEAGWRRACGSALTRDTVRWTKADPAIPWYDVLYCEPSGSDGALAIWAMLYRPEFGRWLTGRPVVDRQALLASRVAAGQGRFEVTGLTLEVARGSYASIVAQFEQAGYRRTTIAGGTRLTGDRWSLTVRAASGPSRLRSIDLATTMPEPARFRIGRATFVGNGRGSAQLRFD